MEMAGKGEYGLPVVIQGLPHSEIVWVCTNEVGWSAIGIVYLRCRLDARYIHLCDG